MGKVANRNERDDAHGGGCHYRRHLKGAPLSIFEYALGVSSRSNGLFFAGIDRVCLETGYGRDTVSEGLAKLCREGWLNPLGGNRSLVTSGGQFQPNKYRVVEHAEWAGLHPGVCSAIARGDKTPSRKNPVAAKVENSVTEKSDNPVTEKFPHITSKREQERDGKATSLFEAPALDAEAPPKPQPSEAGCRLSERLCDLILKNNPSAKITASQGKSWARDADLMLRRDGRTEGQVLEVMDWSQGDNFWKSNILSMGKLRQKFDQLTLKMGGRNNGNVVVRRRMETARALERGLARLRAPEDPH